jgi:PhnB protein
MTMSATIAARTATALIPHLVVDGASAASEFYQAAFGATEEVRMPAPDGSDRLLHVSLVISGLKLYLCDEFPEYCGGGRSETPTALGGSGVTLHLEVADCDAAFEQAVAAGATATMPPADCFWGDRYGQLTDPFGHKWSLASPLSEERKAAAAAAWAEQWGGQ